MPIYKWLENSWQRDVTLPVMKPWLILSNKKALEKKNMKLYHVGQTITDQKKQLTNYGFDNFEEWISSEGLSMTYEKFRVMDWDDALNEQLFEHFSTVILELKKRRHEQDEMDESEYLSSRNMKATSMSSMTVLTVDPHVDASISRDYEITPQKQKTMDIVHTGIKAKKTLFPKEKLQSRKRKVFSSEEEEENGVIPHSFKQYMEKKQATITHSQTSVEDESEPVVDIQPPKMKKNKTEVRPLLGGFVPQVQHQGVCWRNQQTFYVPGPQ
ncbi:unnamed protein product [Parnassius apollo]|uniref:(apollo) hypothetical protein n=1 Tax=Parnassius apollo TaxID=110799 RepID=A0A8S3W257_PARAO|nr:unnamed protein product [Parnassius apollo]